MIIFQTIISFIACLFFSVILYVPKKELFYCGIAGGVSWFVYCYFNTMLNNSVIATFLAAIVVTVVSRFFSHIRRNPSTIFLIPGILPLVPGAGMYYTMTAILEGNIMESYYQAITTFKLAGVVAIGIIIVLSLPYKFFNFIKLK